MSKWTHDVLVDADEYREYAHRLGYALLNCGVIEMFTYTFAAALLGCDVFSTQLNGKTYSTRSKYVQGLLAQATINDELKNRAIEVWRQAGAVMRLRNVIAHNPITIFDVKDAEGTIKSRDVTVIDMTATKGRADVRHIQVAELNKLVNRAQTLTAELRKCLAEMQDQLRASSG